MSISSTFWRCSAAIILSLVTALPSSAEESTVWQLRYQGTLEQISRREANQTVKEFTVDCFLDGTTIGFLMNEPGDGWPWPERFGQITLDQNSEPSNGVKLQVLHTHDGTRYPLELRLPTFAHADNLAADATWKSGEFRYEVIRQVKRGRKSPTTTWEIDVFTNIGKRETLWVEEDSGLLIAMKKKLTLGRGDPFELLMELDTTKELTTAESSSVRTTFAGLLKLQTELGRKKLATRPELTEIQLAKTGEALTDLKTSSQKTPFEKLVTAIADDVKSQSQRDDDVDDLAKKIVGKAAPEFSLEDLAGDAIGTEQLKGQIVILHFWKYHDNPLTEPYGQVAYLDYLHGKRKKLGVSVVGVADDPRLHQSDAAISKKALRDFRKFRDFMNVSYPIALNSGSLLKDLGDPRTVQAALPLWVVIDHHGKVVHYKAGYYQVDPNKGLQDLDNVIIPLIRQRRADQIKANKE